MHHLNIKHITLYFIIIKELERKGKSYVLIYRLVRNINTVSPNKHENLVTTLPVLAVICLYNFILQPSWAEVDKVNIVTWIGPRSEVNVRGHVKRLMAFSWPQNH